jgi:hypothetical protein
MTDRGVTNTVFLKNAKKPERGSGRQALRRNSIDLYIKEKCYLYY